MWHVGTVCEAQGVYHCGIPTICGMPTIGCERITREGGCAILVLWQSLDRPDRKPWDGVGKPVAGKADLPAGGRSELD